MTEAIRVMGLDLSLRATGLVVLVAEKVRGEVNAWVETELCIDPNRRRGMERLDWIRDWLMWNVVGVDDIAIEGYAFSRADSHSHEIGELGGVVKHWLWESGRSWWEMTPSGLKKYVTGKGNAPKEVMMREVFRRWQFDAKDNNTADAYGLARALVGHHFGHARKSDEESWSKARRVSANSGTNHG